MNRLNASLLGVSEVKLFEVGTVFMKDKSADAHSGETREEIHVATADKSGVKEWSVNEYELPSTNPSISLRIKI